MRAPHVLLSLIRSGQIAIVGPRPWAVYCVLLDRIWRDPSTGPRRLRHEVSHGNLVSSLSLGQVSELTGFKADTVGRAIAKLREVGWIELIPGPPKARSVYLLGTRGESGEVYLSMASTPATGSDQQPIEASSTPATGVDDGVGKDRSTPATGSDLSPQRGEATPATGSDLSPQRGYQPNINNNKRTTRTATKVRRVKKVKKVKKVPSNPRSDPVPEEVDGRELDLDEARALRSARVKMSRAREGGGRPGHDYTGPELVASWRLRFRRAFGVEDPDLATKAARTRMARLLSTRIRTWCGGDRAMMLEYLGSMIRLWRDRKPGDFPRSPAPRLQQLLKQTSDGPSTWWHQWVTSRGRKRATG